jgi:CRISPR-associated protein Cmr5
MNRQTRDQERAAHAYGCANKVINSELQADYKSLVNAFGSHVMRSGLCAALAFVQRKQAKDEDAQAKRGHNAAGVFVGHLNDYLSRDSLLGLAQDKGDLMTRVQGLPVHDYMLVTREVLALSLWFRRAVQALMPDERPEADHG